MSSTVDNRVVQMKFDNKDFESNVKTSLSTLKNLNKSLEMTNGTDGLDKLAKSAKGVSLDHLASSVGTIQERFSALGIIGMTALQNITNSAIEAGKQMLKSLTIDPIKDGLNEYELKMGSIQTIMNSSGEGLPVVKKYLEELNEYADRTIYSFKDMTSSIGKFTNSGVSLDDSVAAIQGISNLAATAGANAEQASHAMYNFAQALSSGSVKLVDWKSINVAGMDTVEFKNALLDTAVAMGTVTKDGDKFITTTTNAQGKISEAFDATAKWNDSLQHNWITSEVLIETLKKYTDETTEFGRKAFESATQVKTFSQLMDTLREGVGSGWAETFEIIIGDFYEAIDLWTKVNNVIGGILSAQADARNDMLREWKNEGEGGRTVLIEAITNAWEGLLSVLGPVRDAFRDVFPPMTGKRLYELTVALRDLTSHFKISTETADNLRSTFRGLFAILDIVKQAFVFLIEIVKPIIGLFGDMGGGILGVTGAIGDWIYVFDQGLQKTDLFRKTGELLAAGLRFLADMIGLVFDKLKKLPGPLDNDAAQLEAMRKVTEKLGEAFEFLHKHLTRFADAIKSSKTWNEFFNVLIKGFSGLYNLVSQIGPHLITIFRSIGDAIADFSRKYNTDVFADLLGGGFLAVFIVGIKKIIDIVKELKSISNSIIDVLDGVRGCLEAYQQKLKADILLEIAIAIGLLTASLVILSTVDSNKLSVAAGAMAMLFGELVGAMFMYQKLVSFDSFKDSAKFATGMIGMIGLAAAVVQMAKALKILGEMEWNQVLSGMTALSGVTVSLIALTKVISKYEASLTSSAIGIVGMALALQLMVVPIKELASLELTQLTKGMAAMGAMLLELATFFEIAEHVNKLGVSQGVGLVLFATSMVIIAQAIKQLGQLELGQMGVALTSIAGALAVLILTFEELDNTEHIVKTATALLITTAALNLLALAIKSLGETELWSTIKALVAFGIAFKMVIAALKEMPEKSLTMGTSLLMIGKALKSVAEAMVMIGGLSLWTIAKGLGAIAVSLGAMSTALVVVSNDNALKGAAAIAVVSASLLLLAPALKLLGTMSIGEIIISLIAMAGALTVIGVAGIALAPAVPAIVGLGVAIALLSSSLLVGGTALLLFAKALALIGATGAVAAAAVVGLITAVASTIPLLFEQVGKGIVAFVEVIKGSIVTIVAAAVEIVKAVCDGLKESIPYVAETIIGLIDDVLLIVADHLPSILTSVFKILLIILHGVEENIGELTDVVVSIIVNFINSLANRLPDMIQAAMNLIGSFFKGIVEALKGVDTTSLIEGIAGVGLLTGLMVALGSVVALIPAAMVGVLGMGAVIAELALVLAAVGAFAQIPGLNWLVEEGGELLKAIGTALGKFFGGLAGGVLNGISAQLPKIGTDLSAFMENASGFIEGVARVDSSMYTSVKALVESILLLTAANILDGLTRWLTGGTSLAKFGQELCEFGPYFKLYAQEISGINSDVVNASANAAHALAELSANLPATGGLVGKIFGEKRLSDFGKELVAFAPYIKQYSIDVEGITPETVQASADAAKILSDMASTLPNSGGLASLILGDNTLSQFGYELSKFGPYIAAYSESVADISPNVVVASANAAKALAELAHNIPNSGGLISLFTGNNDIDKFGKGLKSFGKAFAKYYDSVANINTSQLANVTFELRKLVNLASGMTSIDTSGMSRFAKDFKKMANSGIDEFLKAFKDAGTKVKSAVTAFFTDFKKQFTSKSDELKKSGKDTGAAVIKELAAGLKEIKPAIDALNTLIDEMIKTLEQKVKTSRIQNAGKEMAKTLADGVETSASIRYVQNAGSNLSTALYNQVIKFTSSMDSAGKQLVNGLIGGLYNKDWVAALRNAGYYVGNTLLNSLKSALGIHSPSKEGEKIGQQTDEGITVGLKKNSANVLTISKKVGETVDEGITKGLQKESIKVTNTAKKTGESASKTLTESMSFDSVLEKISEQLSKLIDLLEEHFKESSFNQYGVNVTDGVSSGISSIKSDATASDAVEGYVDNIGKDLESEVVKNKSKYTSIGETISESVADGILKKSTAVNTKLETATKQYTSTLTKETQKQLDSQSSADISWEPKAKVESSGSTKTTAQEAVNTLVKETQKQLDSQSSADISWEPKAKVDSESLSKSMRKASNEMGLEVSKGVSVGINKGTSTLTKAGKMVGGTVLSGIKSSLSINSPSKEGEKIGEYVDVGVANGLTNFAKRIVSSAKDVGKTVKDTLSSALSNISTIIEDGYISDPVIRPVVDLTDVEYGINQMDGLFGSSRSISLAGDASNSMNGFNHSMQKDLNRVTDAVTKLQDTVDKLRNEHGDVTNYFNITQQPGESMEDFAKYVAQFITREYVNQKEVWGTA